jgi:hypothetical protein
LSFLLPRSHHHVSDPRARFYTLAETTLYLAFELGCTT